jgi:tRNA pseudouridine38-40 synthase
MDGCAEAAVPTTGSFPDGDGGLVRVRLDLDYDGTRFAGWAAQPGQRTVAGVLVAGLGVVLRTDPEQLGLVVAGRTDSGVHAIGQVCHIDCTPQAWAALPGRSDLDPSAAMVRRLAGVLPDDVRVRSAVIAPDGFDARFSAIRRRYAYRVSDHPAGPPPLRRHDVFWYRRPLDVAVMDEAARRMVGLRDFAAYCRRREGATTVRTLLEYSWHRDADDLVVARVVADAFCHSMVRALVGGALAVGEGRCDVDWPSRVLTGRVRHPGVNVAPPHGLVLEQVGYPPDDELALRARQARAMRSMDHP